MINDVKAEYNFSAEYHLLYKIQTSAQSSLTGVMLMLPVKIQRDPTSAFVRLDLKETGKNALVRKS